MPGPTSYTGTQTGIGLITSWVMSTLAGSLTTTFRPPGWMKLTQPFDCDWSIMLPGPQTGLKSGPVKLATEPPPAAAAQSRRTVQSWVSGCDGMDSVFSPGS